MTKMELPENYPNTEDKFVKWIDDFRSTSGFKKLLNYLDEVVKKDLFQNAVKKVREEYKIPINGFVEDKTKPSRFIKTSKGEMEIPYTTKQDWKFFKDTNVEKEIYEIAKLLSKNYDYENELAEVFERYIYTNEIEILYEGTWRYNMCMVSDLIEEKEEPYSKDYQDNMENLYPIALRIRPEATKRDILDFVNKMFKYDIHWSQLKYKNQGQKVGKSKRKNSKIQDRNNYIYENRKLQPKVIQKMVADKFGWQDTIDTAYIGKIVQLETKKRKDV